MKIPFHPLLAAGLLMVATGPVQSQQINPASLQTRQAYVIPLQNVQPRIMLSWLNTPPQSQQPPLKGSNLYLNPPPASRDYARIYLPSIYSWFTLPEGINNIIPDDVKKELIVFGDVEAAKKLADTVRFLDHPLSQVGFEIHIIAMRPEDITDFGLNFDLPPNELRTLPTAFRNNHRPTYAIVRGDLPALLEKRRLSSRTNEIATLRITTQNNLLTDLDVSRSHAAPPSLENEMKYLPSQDGTPLTLEIRTPLQISLTPTINNDETITLLMNLNGQVQLARLDTSDSLSVSRSNIQTVVNIKDGDTIAIRGFNQSFTSAFLAPPTPQKFSGRTEIPIISELFHPQNPLSGELMVFLTPRIMRRPAP